MTGAAGRPPRVLVISADAVGREMAGTGIRSYEIARALAPHAEVTLAAVESGATPVEDVRQVGFHVRDSRALRPHLEKADVVFAQPQWPTVHRWLRDSGARLIFDLYNVEAFEALEFMRQRPLLRRVLGTMGVDRTVAALRDGHHFVCASEAQRDLWLGVMLAERLIRPVAYDRDPTLLSVIDKVPFGVPSEPPLAVRGAVRERFPAIRDGDEVVLWNGGIWSWLDAPTAVRAMAALERRRPAARLVFMGAASHGPALDATREARSLAEELGLLDRTVFFNDRWVEYARRAEWLLDADCAISTHVDHLETRFAFRTRLLDCLWAGVPIVCTEGDELARLVGDQNLGATAVERDHEGIAAALDRVLEQGRDSYAGRLRAAAERFSWPSVTAPLRRWLDGPVPPRLGAGVPRHPLPVLRDTGYRAARAGLNRVGLRDWPRL